MNKKFEQDKESLENQKETRARLTNELELMLFDLLTTSRANRSDVSLILLVALIAYRDPAFGRQACANLIPFMDSWIKETK